MTRDFWIRYLSTENVSIESPSVMEIAALLLTEQKETLWDETKRLFYPHKVYVDLSRKLYDAKAELIKQI